RYFSASRSIATLGPLAQPSFLSRFLAVLSQPLLSLTPCDRSPSLEKERPQFGMALEPPRLCVIASGRRSIARRLVRSASRRKDVTQLSRSAWRTGKVAHVIPSPQGWTRVPVLSWFGARRRHGAGAGIPRFFVDPSISLESRLSPCPWRRA